jgi:hypothetical protein
MGEVGQAGLPAAVRGAGMRGRRQEWQVVVMSVAAAAMAAMAEAAMAAVVAFVAAKRHLLPRGAWCAQARRRLASPRD